MPLFLCPACLQAERGKHIEKLEKEAVEILSMMCGSGCVIADSGGKDSSVVKHIAVLAHEKYGMPFSIRHNHTTVDAPETVYFVRSEQKKYREVGISYEICYPAQSMWQLIVRHKIPPTRMKRYCCECLKENYGRGEKLVTGVRKAESVRRKNMHGAVTIFNTDRKLRNSLEGKDGVKEAGHGGIAILNLDNDENRRLVENCYRTYRTLVNPLIDWDDEFLWWYIRKEQIHLNPLYECGFKRIGCIGCPMAGRHRWDEFARYPKYRDAYVRAFDRMVAARREGGLKVGEKWETGLKVFKWWMQDDVADGQLAFDTDGTVYEMYV